MRPCSIQANGVARSKSSARWLKEHFNDPYVKRAQAEGWRSRAVFKLEELIDRDRLLEMVQGREAHLFDRAVDNQVSRLRRKIEADSRNPQLIQTVWGGGYMLAAEVRRRPAGARD